MSNTQTADLTRIRECNEQMVLTLIREAGPISRAELARRTRLSRSTISSIITTLLAANTVYETGIGDSQGGRRPIMLDFNYRSSLVVGIDLSTTTITLILADLQAQVLQRAQVPCDIELGPGVCVPQIAEVFAAALKAAEIDLARIGWVGVGVPGPLSSAAGRTIAPPVMPGWHDVPLRALLEQALGRQVLLENDANVAALAEHTWGAARDLHNVAYIYLGSSGIGGGLILDGQLYRGHVGSAGEIGHVVIDEHGPPCSCGSSGCLEALAGSPVLIERARHQGLRVTEIADLVAYACIGDARAQSIIADAGAYLGVAVANLLNLLNPGVVVIGGALAEAGDVLLDPLRATLSRRGLAVASRYLALRPGELGDDVVALGAATLAIRQLFRAPLASAVAHPPNRAVSELYPQGVPVL